MSLIFHFINAPELDVCLQEGTADKLSKFLNIPFNANTDIDAANLTLQTTYRIIEIEDNPQRNTIPELGWSSSSVKSLLINLRDLGQAAGEYPVQIIKTRSRLR